MSHNHTKKCDQKVPVYFIPDTYAEDNHKAKALVLSCIDYRLISDTIEFLESQCYAHAFDFTTLAGASLGFNQHEYPCWNETFLQQVDLAIELHHIKKIIVIDHMDCGAYKLFYPCLQKHHHYDDVKERILHIKNIRKFVSKMREIYPKFVYHGYIIDLNGEVEEVCLAKTKKMK
jgi:hypothetical protein